MPSKIIFWLLLAPTALFSQDIEEWARQRVDLDETPGIALAWIENGQRHFASFGVASLETKMPVTSKTLFEIGSITKTFTCSAFSWMVQHQELGLQDRAQVHLPSSIVLPQKNGKSITLLQLATAHSGLPRMPGNFSPEDPTNPYIDYTDKELTAFLNNCELKNEPGALYEYSNLGMGLLGYILTQTRNQTYSQLIHQILLKPLQMRETYISGEVKNKWVATGYLDKNPAKAWTWTGKSVLTGAGGILSNAEDMMTFVEAQWNTGQPDLATAFHAAQQERSEAGSDSLQIGLGWHIRKHQIIWHNGGTGGFRSFVGFDPANKRGIVILTNSTTGADDLGFHWLDKTYPLKNIKKPVQLTGADALEYEGVYQITPGFKISITAQDNQLFLQATDQPKLSLYAEAPDEFFLKVVAARIQFGRNAENKIEKLTLFQNGAELHAQKIK